MIKKSLIISLVFVLAWVTESSFTPLQGSNLNTLKSTETALTDTQVIYKALENENTVSMPSEEAFTLAMKGFNNLKSIPGKVKKDILTVVDFSLPSTEKRLWVIDLSTNKVLFNDWVAHGKNSG
ncbi:MAG: murein L,D-transpeptidase catalytic domain-containing protein, partial [Tangfeifania sp.]